MPCKSNVSIAKKDVLGTIGGALVGNIGENAVKKHQSRKEGYGGNVCCGHGSPHQCCEIDHEGVKGVAAVAVVVVVAVVMAGVGDVEFLVTFINNVELQMLLFGIFEMESYQVRLPRLGAGFAMLSPPGTVDAI